MNASRMVAVIAAILLISMNLAACQPGKWRELAKGLTAKSRYGYPSPSYAHIFEGSNSKVLNLSRSEIPIALSFFAQKTSAWMILYEIDEQIMYYIETPDLQGEDPPLQLSNVTDSVVSVRVEHETLWTVYGTYLNESIYLEVPGAIQGSGQQVVFFTSGMPQTIKVDAEPGLGRFSLIGIDSPNSSSVLVSTDTMLSQTFRVSPEILGLIIRTNGSWTLQVMDHLEISE